MNTNNNSHNPLPEPRHADLAALDAALSRLGRADRAEALPGLEARLFAVTRTAIAPLPRDIAAVGERVDRLAAVEAGTARPELETQAFELSREAVAGGRFTDAPAPTLRLTGDRERPAVVVRTRSFAWAMRVAAAVAIVGAAVSVWQMGNRTPTGSPDTAVAVNTTDQLAERISDEMDVLFEVMGTGHSEAAAGLGDADSDTSWVDDLFSKESL